MKERPILFSAPMVRALLDGSKTQTRRACKPMNEWVDQECREVRMVDGAPHHFLKCATVPMEKLRCPYGQPGDRLYVRETWAQPTNLDPGPTVYRADYPACVPPGFTNLPAIDEITWKPSIHMPRALSRILLEVVSVRVERLQEISREDAVAEGIERVENNYGNGPAYCDYRMADPRDTAEWFSSPINSYRSLWERINGAGSWDANPWVWVVEFKRATP